MWDCLKQFNPQSLQGVYKVNKQIIEFSDKMKNIDKQIKSFLKHQMYDNKKVKDNTNKGKKVIKDLFLYLAKNPRKHINKNLFLHNEKERVISDFIAGMTDRYAINLHKLIK